MKPRVLITRPAGSAEKDIAALASLGFEVIHAPLIEIVFGATPVMRSSRNALVDTVRSTPEAVLYFSSSQAIDSMYSNVVDADTAERLVVAVGPQTVEVARRRGFHNVVMPESDFTVSGLIEVARSLPATVAVVPRSSQSPATLTNALQSAGWTLVSAVTYETRTVADRPSEIDHVVAGEFAAVVVRSGSAVRALAELTQGKVPLSTAIIAGGTSTAAAIKDAGLHLTAIASEPDAQNIARAVFDAVGEGKS